MSAMAVSDQAFGELRGDVKAIQKDLSEVETDMKDVKKAIDAINMKMSEVSGGLRVAIWFSGIIGALAMFGLTKIAPMLLGALPKI